MTAVVSKSFCLGRKGNIHLFVRPAVADLWKIMSSRYAVNGRALIEGPPGVGKSAAGLMWLLNEAQRGKVQHAFWFHWSKGTIRSVVKVTSEGGQIFICTYEGSIGIAARDWPSWTDVCSRASVICLDGITGVSREFMLDACTWAMKASKSVLIFASQSISLNDEDSDDMNLEYYKVASWTKEEYQRALSTPAIRDQVKALQGLVLEPTADSKWFEEQYFYAGGSARLMFDYCVEDNVRKGVRTRLNQHIEGCNDYGSVFRIGPKSSNSVNHLYSRIEEKKLHT